MMTTILLIVGLNFLKSGFRRRLIFSLTLLVMGYVVFLIGLVLVRGWDGMGWSLIGFSLYVIGFITYIGVVTYHWFKARRKTHS
ncbi:YesK family protein [Exiguobacterium mexicanum]|uniref:YesK family protein n=1 Tax=Exiguobacterium mexicanum TaxID=340146 RepID=A0ABT7MSW5_9BACL|nr:YesK family protein [Exiguobacterium mexicanum]MDL5378290.1 YesK family protein [Exiguobacterium mexicanum]